MTTHTATLSAPRVKTGNGIHVGGWIGYGAIWAFMIVFLIYPLLHLFYDAFTTDAGEFTFLNFQDFFTDRYYLKSLLNSMLLGVGTVITTSIIGITFAFLLLRYEFPGRGLFSYLSIVPMIMPPLVGVM
ncbi:MAG TPA: hypothetical protein VLT56_02170, partial [Desulfobacterales bacterium]|nr:hypothetical protein [Desulfobacterales bacterium]